MDYDIKLHDFSSLFSLKGKIAVITGGSRGLGLSAASAILQAGAAKVYISSRKKSACDEAVAALNQLPGLAPGAKAISVPADVASKDGLRQLVDAVHRDSPEGIDILRTSPHHHITTSHHHSHITSHTTHLPMAYQLDPLPAPIGVFSQYMAPQTETLVLKEKVLSLSGDSFAVQLASGAPLLTVQGKVFSMGARKSVLDTAGRHLFDIYREPLHLHTTYVLEDPAGNKFFELRHKIQVFGTTATASFTSPATGTAEALTMKGSFFDTRGEITSASGHVVAVIDRHVLSARHLVFGQDAYGVVVAPGMDLAIVAAMCICLDDKNERTIV